MPMQEVVRPDGGPWALMACATTDPAWVGWVHNAAAGWLAEVIRLRDAGRAAGVEGADVASLWPVRVQYTRDLITAIGNLARALNTPIPSFGPWASALLNCDVGPDPWPGWGFHNTGLWRYDILGLVAEHDETVRHALVGDDPSPNAVRTALSDPEWSGQLDFDQLAHRVNLAVDGTPITTYLTGEGALAPNIVNGHEADRHGSDCGPAGGVPTGWTCVDWAVWAPGVLEGGITSFNAIVNLQRQWQLGTTVADTLQGLGTVENVMAAARSFQNLKNSVALQYLASLSPPIVANTPADLYTVLANDQAARLNVPRSAVITRMLGSTIASSVAAGPVGLAILIGTSIPEFLYQIFGQAQGRWFNVWGQREPAPAVASLSGVIDLQRPIAPVIDVAPSPPPPSRPLAEVMAAKNAARARGSSKSATLLGVHTPEELAAVQAGVPLGPVQPVVGKPVSGGAVALGLGALLLLLAK